MLWGAMQIQKQTTRVFSSSSPVSKGRLTGQVKIFAFRTDLLKLIRVRIPVGASVFQRPPTDDVEWFLSMLRFDSREKVNALARNVSSETSKTTI